MRWDFVHPGNFFHIIKNLYCVIIKLKAPYLDGCAENAWAGSLGRGRIVVVAAGDHRPVYQTPVSL